MPSPPPHRPLRAPEHARALPATTLLPPSATRPDPRCVHVTGIASERSGGRWLRGWAVACTRAIGLCGAVAVAAAARLAGGRTAIVPVRSPTDARRNPSLCMGRDGVCSESRCGMCGAGLAAATASSASARAARWRRSDVCLCAFCAVGSGCVRRVPTMSMGAHRCVQTHTSGLAHALVR